MIMSKMYLAGMYTNLDILQNFVIFLTKTEFSRLTNFIDFVERETNKNLKTLKKNNGLEYCCRQVQQILTEGGIRQERSNVYSSQ